MAIRPARDDDFSAITAITNHYIVTSAVHFAYEPLAEAALRAQWHGYRERFPWFRDRGRRQVVGFAKAGTWRDRAAYAWTAETGVYLADSARGRGLGRRVYVAMLDELVPRLPLRGRGDHAAQRSERRRSTSRSASSRSARSATPAGRRARGATSGSGRSGSRPTPRGRSSASPEQSARPPRECRADAK